MKMVMEPSVTNPGSLPPPVVAAAMSQSTGGNGAVPVMAGGVHQPPFNPQSLGREFVRQYYTVLNQGPHILHRFYSDDSSLIHGDLNRQGDATDPVHGQAEINSKIVSLNFKDCHAKIRQVDSLETVGKGVVVQVTGELSNNGQPLRRFFQTFVLAPRSPTNYYVRNEIFRYQDEVFDEEEYQESEKIDNVEPEKDVVEPTQTVNISAVQHATKAVVLDHERPLAQVQAKVITVNGNHMSDSEKLEEVDGLVNSKAPAPSASTPTGDATNWNNINVKSETVATIASAPAAAPEAAPLSPIPPSGPRTWAARISAANAATVASKPHVMVAHPAPSAPSANAMIKNLNEMVITPGPLPGAPQQVEVPLAPLELAQVEHAAPGVALVASVVIEKPPLVNNVGAQPNQPPREQRAQGGGRGPRTQNRSQRNEGPREPTPGRGDAQSEGSQGGEDNRGDFYRAKPPNNHPDDQQVFVGNLPADITEEQLGAWFSKFGTILDVRINRTNQKTGATRTPNYGFVTFNDSSVVKGVLAQKPIYFNEHRFNVEEKRSQPRGGGGGNVNRSGSGAGQGGGGGGGRNYGDRQGQYGGGGHRQYNRDDRDNNRDRERQYNRENRGEGGGGGRRDDRGPGGERTGGQPRGERDNRVQGGQFQSGNSDRRPGGPRVPFNKQQQQQPR